MRMVVAPTRKVAANLSVRPELARRAKALGLNLSEILEKALEEATRTAEEAAWLRDNEGAIAAYNAEVAERGVFSDGWRRF
jgi:antitoxin CcdA